MSDQVLQEKRPLRSRLRALYFGHTQDALAFQGVLFVLDLIIIGFFIAGQFIAAPHWYWIADAAIAVFLVIDMGARAYALGSFKRWIIYPSTWADIVVLATLTVPLFANLGFLRVLRLWSTVHRERFWNVLGGGRWDDTHVEDITRAVVTLIVFVFIAAGVTQALFLGHHPELNNFVDALYFVVTSLTTTGYGDIALDSAWGRIFSIALMVTGISLFVNIARSAFAPSRRIARCSCGVTRHDLDARFCKGCGKPLEEPVRKRIRRAGGGSR